MTWKAGDNFSVAQTEHGAVVLDQTKGCYWELNTTGGLVIEAASRGATLEEVISSVQQQFEVEYDLARADVEGLIETAVEMGLLRQ
jgi:hypothetical protein